MVPSFTIVSFVILCNTKFMTTCINMQLKSCSQKRQWQLPLKRTNVAINMVLVLTTRNHILESMVFKGKHLSRTKAWPIGKKRKSFNICLKKPLRTYNKRNHSKLVYKLQLKPISPRILL